jgi:hypothetical protein
VRSTAGAGDLPEPRFALEVLRDAARRAGSAAILAAARCCYYRDRLLEVDARSGVVYAMEPGSPAVRAGFKSSIVTGRPIITAARMPNSLPALATNEGHVGV